MWLAKSSTRVPSSRSDVGMLARGVQQRGLQIAAMDHPVGRAVALSRHRRAECARSRGPSARRSTRTADGATTCWRRRSAEAERDQDAGRVRGELNAGAGFFRAARPARARRRGSRCRASASAAVSPPMPPPPMMMVRDAAHGACAARLRPRRSAQAHSAGRAACGSSDGSWRYSVEQ